MDNKLIGVLGETMAAQYYRKNGYEIICANFRTRQGEIDLIVKKGSVMAFVEVKTRSCNAIATGKEFVTKAKQKRITLAAQNYISVNNTDCDFRFDVVEIHIDKDGEKTLNCIENAFLVT